ncbi:MAG: hypothetical protein JWO91_324, partial [Acidobacteriaceae bacterium]|nr:hypothetical protein [Acidobacteriaceae bacterium]
MQNNMSAPHELTSPEGNARSDAPWWKLSRLGKIPLPNARVAQKITSGCGPTSRTTRPTLMARSVFLNWQRARWTACFIAITTIVHPAQSQQTKTAEPNVAAANRAVQSQLPFSDRQDFEDAMRGFIATTHDAANPDRYAILKHEAPPTVNPSLWRQAQLNATNGLFKVSDGVYQVRGFSQAYMTIVEGTTGLIVIDTLTSPGAAREALDLYFAHRPRKPVVAVIYSHSHPDHYGG